MSSASHSVSSHLHLDTAEYDRVIRTYIPYYEESRAVLLDFLAPLLGDADARVADIGGGTGSLAESILTRFPRVSAVVRDIDPEMLAVARDRLARFGDRVQLDQGSFLDPLPTVDAAVSAFALHHVPRLDEKTRVYGGIREALRPGGLFLNNDAVSGPFWPRLREEWAAFMATQGYTLEQAYGHLDDWAAEDTYFSVREELAALAGAGFRAPECLWRRGPVAILGALED